jgi:hypothetical protein
MDVFRVSPNILFFGVNDYWRDAKPKPKAACMERVTEQDVKS